MNRAGIPFYIIGGASLISGGLISAVSAGAPSYTASWAVAYIVLVAGVAQLVLGIGQAQLAAKRPSAAVVAGEAIALNLANAAVLLGTLIAAPALTYLGAGLLVVALAIFVWAARGTRTHNKWLLYAFRIMIAVLAVSAPIGLLIARARAG